MADFTKAIDYVLANEGGYEPAGTADPGGETNFGISKRQYPFLDIKSLTRDDAVGIYERDYWKFEGVANERVAAKLLDMYVNMPPHTAIRLAQLALKGMQAGPVVADGKFGTETLEHINAADPDRLLDELKYQLVKFYYEDAVENPSTMPELHGWWRRAVREPR